MKYGHREQEVSPPQFVAEKVLPDRSMIAAIMAHGLITKGATRSIIPKDAVQLADELLKELGEVI